MLRWGVAVFTGGARQRGYPPCQLNLAFPRPTSANLSQSVSSRKLQPCVRSVVSSITLVRAIAFNVHITCRRHEFPATIRSSTFDSLGARVRRKGYSRRCVFFRSLRPPCHRDNHRFRSYTTNFACSPIKPLYELGTTNTPHLTSTSHPVIVETWLPTAAAIWVAVAGPPKP